MAAMRRMATSSAPRATVHYVESWASRCGSALRPRPWAALPEALTAQFEWKGTRFLLLGVMHGSPDSVQHVEKALRRVEPDAVVLELDPTWDQPTAAAPGTDPVKEAIEQQRWLLAYQRLFGFPSTQFSYERDTPEVVHALKLAKSLGIPAVLGDRSNELSSLRVFKGLPIQRKLYSLINIPLMHYLPKEKTPPSEARPSYAEMRTIVEERNGVIFPEPAMQLVLMHERARDSETGAAADLYFVQQLQALRANTVVGVFGMAHLPGMLAFWDRASTVPISVLDTPDQGFKESAELWLSVFGPQGRLSRPPAEPPSEP